MAKHEYSKSFDEFWLVYPRKTAKRVAYKAWIKNGIEGDAFLPRQITQDVEKRSRLKWWNKDHSKIPHASTWINQARWEDEGWENELDTGKDSRPQPKEREYIPIPNTGPDLTPWQMMLNRLMLSYLRAHGRVSSAALRALIRTKNEVHSELIAAATEEIESASDKGKVRGEMSWLFADMMISRFDTITGRSLKWKILDSGGEPA